MARGYLALVLHAHLPFVRHPEHQYFLEENCLYEAITAGGTTLRDHLRPDGQLGYFQHSFAVYDREGQPCACGTPIRRIIQSGRSTFFCPTCQK